MTAPSTPSSESPDVFVESPDQSSTFSSQQTLHNFGHGHPEHQCLNLSDVRKNRVQPEGEAKKMWISSEHPNRNRTLILCFDGTGDHFDSDVCVLNNISSPDVEHQYRTPMSFS